MSAPQPEFPASLEDNPAQARFSENEPSSRYDPPVTLAALKKLGKVSHRIVWFGNIFRGRSSDGINVIFSPCAPSLSTGEEECDFSKRTSVPLPVAYLRKFRIGDIWENCRWTGRRDTQARASFRLDISKHSAEVMPIGVPINNDHANPTYLLPFSHFGGHRDHTHAQCLRIALEDGSTLIIPCMELVRFYFGASGSFLKRLFSGAFALDRLYANARINRKTGAASIDLAPDLSGVAAATIARIAFNSQARSAARWIVNSGVATAANRSSYYPKTTFPFYGQTELTVYGRWIIHGGSRTFLAEQLSRCTHPFPFDTLFYSTSRSLLTAGKPGGRTKLATKNSPVCAADTSEAAILLTDDPISNTLQSMGISAEDEGAPSFPDLANKRVCRVGKKKPGKTTASQSTHDELGAGAETSSSQVRGAEVASDLEEILLDGLPPPDAAEMVERAISLNAAAKPGYMAWRSMSGEQEPQESFVRCDVLLKDDSDRQLQNVWAGIFEVKIGTIVAPALALVRDNITEDADDHILLLRLDPLNIRRNVDKYCRMYAAGSRLDVYGEDMLERIESQRATDLYGLLRRLSMIARKLLQ